MKDKFTIFICVLAFNLNAQIRLDKSLVFENQITSIDVSFDGSMFVGFSNGKILKASNGLDSLIPFQIPEIGEINFIESRNRLKTFFFSWNQQQYIIMERLSSNAIVRSVSDFTDGFVDHATIGTDNNLWMLESQSGVLRKKDLNSGISSLEIPIYSLLGISDVLQMRSYKQFLVLSTLEKGLIILDQFGNQIKTIPNASPEKFQILNDKIIYLENEQVVEFSILNQKKEVLKGPPTYYGVINVGKRYCFLKKKQIDCYNLR